MKDYNGKTFNEIRKLDGTTRDDYLKAILSDDFIILQGSGKGSTLQLKKQKRQNCL